MDQATITMTEREAIQIFLAMSLMVWEYGGQFQEHEASFLGKVKSAFPRLGDLLDGKNKVLWEKLPS